MPKPTVVRFTVAALAAVLLLAACSDEVPVPTSTPTPGPTATSSPEPTPSPTAVPGAVPLEIGPEVPFPESTALIVETGCWRCDGPTTGLLRVYQRPNGDFAIETLLNPIIPASREGSENAPTITGYAIAPDLSEIVVGICTRGTCTTDGLYSWSAISNLAIYRSVDGGITWEEVGEVPSGVGMYGIVGAGRYLVARSEIRNEMTYEIFPDGEQIPLPLSAKWILDVVVGEPLWWTEKESWVLRQDGTTFADFGYDTRVWRASSDGSTTILLWDRTSVNRASHFLSVMKGGSITHYQLSAVAMAIPYRDDLILANVYPSGDSLPSVIDANAGVVSPIGEPFAVPDFPPGRNYIVAFQRGPFARVVNTGSCLNVRDAPSLESNVLACAADRVLLHIDSAEPPAPGWLEVTTPSGTHGYASTLYLEIPFP